MRGLTLGAAALAMFVLGSIYAYGVVLPALADALHVTRGTAALPHAVLLFVYAVGMAIGGVLQDRLRPTRIAILGGVLFGLGVWWAGSATSTAALVLRYGLLGGLGFGFTYVAAVSAVMHAYPTRRGFAAGVVVGAFGLGLFIWAPLAEYFLTRWGWAALFTHFGLLALIVLPVLGLGIRAVHPTAARTAQPGLPLAQAVGSGLFRLIFLAYLLVTAVGLLLSTHLPAFGMLRGLTTAQAPLLLSAFAVGSALGRVLMGTWSDRVGRFPVLIGATLGAVVVLLALTRATGAGLFACAVTAGFAYGTWLTLYGPLATDLFGLRAAGAIYGVLYLSYGLGGLLGPWAGGVLADRTGSYTPAFLTGAALCLLAAGVFHRAARRPPHFAHPPVFEEEFPVE